MAADYKVTVAILPTGGGKTWLAGLLDQIYRKRNETVAIVTSKQFLVNQIKSMYGVHRHSCSVMTIAEALLRQDEFSTFIIDEADSCVLENGYIVDELNYRVRGFWDLLQKRTVLLTATVGYDMQTILAQEASIKPEQYLDFRPMLRDIKASSFSSHVNVKVLKNLSEHRIAVEETIVEVS